MPWKPQEFWVSAHFEITCNRLRGSPTFTPPQAQTGNLLLTPQGKASRREAKGRTPGSTQQQKSASPVSPSNVFLGMLEAVSLPSVCTAVVFKVSTLVSASRAPSAPSGLVAGWGLQLNFSLCAQVQLQDSETVVAELQ